MSERRRRSTEGEKTLDMNLSVKIERETRNKVHADIRCFSKRISMNVKKTLKEMKMILQKNKNLVQLGKNNNNKAFDFA